MTRQGFKADTVVKVASVATTGNVVLSGIQNLDGLTGASGDIVCVWQQTAPAENGLYVMLSGAWKRIQEFNEDSNMRGAVIEVLNGTLYGKRTFQCSNTSAINVGVTAIRIDLRDSAENLVSGFLSWSGSGNFWSLTGSDLTVLRAGEGRVMGKRVVWAAGQSVSLTANKGYFIVINSVGVLTAVDIASLVNANKLIYFENFKTFMCNNIVLFSGWFDGVELILSKNTHPYSYNCEISAHDHFRLGSVFTGTGAKISLLSATNRTIQSVGADLIDDHGVLTSIPDYNASALSLIGVWRNGSGLAQRYHRRNFTINAASTAPTAGATYTDVNGNTWTVLFTNVAKTLVECWASVWVTQPPSSGDLTKTGGTGDATLTFTSVATNRVVPTSYISGGVPVPLGSGGATRYGICAIYAHPTDLQSPSVAAPAPQFVAVMSTVAYNSNSNAASSIGTGSTPDLTQFTIPVEIEALEPVLMGFVICDGSDRQIEAYTGNGFVNGVRSLKQTSSSQFASGAVAIADALNVLVDASAFDGILETTDTTVKAVVDRLNAYGKVALLQEDIIPVDFMEDGAAAPDASALYTNGKAKIRARKFSGTANQDLYFNWPVPEQINAAVGIQFAVEYIISEASAPSEGNIVSFKLAGYSVGNGDTTDGTFGTAVASSRTHPAGDAQHDRYLTEKSAMITVTNLAVLETAILQLQRDAEGADSYGEKVAVTGIRIYWSKLKA